jgi:hypothetical protein
MEHFIKIVLMSFLILSNYIFTQRQNAKSKSEGGLTFGAMYYIGDLNTNNHFENSKANLGLIYRYNINPRLAFRTHFSYGNLMANDAKSKNIEQQNRNLSFQTDIYEFASGIEMNFVNYQIGSDKHRVSPYLFFQMGIFRMNPKTYYNNELIELQPLGTEGQGTELSKATFYKRVQMCLPIGIGLKLSLSKMISFNIEYGFRKTFTDYIDDVSSFRYVDRGVLSSVNGPIVSDLSNRSLDNNSYGRRGNPTTKDWYFVCNAMLVIKLGNPNKCFHH